ncbi:MAG: hypothetical protein ACXV5Q_12750 [Frankiaceae bacterium]
MPESVRRHDLTRAVRRHDLMRAARHDLTRAVRTVLPWLAAALWSDCLPGGRRLDLHPRLPACPAALANGGVSLV